MTETIFVYGTLMPNCPNAHILLDYAKKYNKQTELKVRLQEAYYSEKKDIGDPEVLYYELQKVGLNADDAIKTLNNETIIKRIREEERYWKNTKGVYAIPTMFFNTSIKKVGAHQEEVYKKLLIQLLN